MLAPLLAPLLFQVVALADSTGAASALGTVPPDPASSMALGMPPAALAARDLLEPTPMGAKDKLLQFPTPATTASSLFTFYVI